MDLIGNAKKLMKDIEKKIDKWNERSCFSMKGLKNLSRADLDTLILYSEQFIKNGGNGFNGLMPPRGSIKKVLDAYGICEKELSFDSLYN
jgi:hypothetical protein